MTPWPLPKLLEANRNAVTLYVTLLHLAGGHRGLTTTRARIRTVCGLSEKRITAAVDALATAGWIRRTYHRRGIKRWYRIGLPMGLEIASATGPKTPHSGRNGARTAKGSKATHSAAKVRAENDPKRIIRYGAENDPLPLTGNSTPRAGGGGVTNEHPAARLERETLEHLRAARDPCKSWQFQECG